jgi:hypothetical protein
MVHVVEMKMKINTRTKNFFHTFIEEKLSNLIISVTNLLISEHQKAFKYSILESRQFLVSKILNHAFGRGLNVDFWVLDQDG